MIIKNIYNYLFYITLSFLVVVLLFTANDLSISYKEALNVFVNNSVLSMITKASITIFGQNDIALRLPFLLFYVLSVLLMYKLTENYFKLERHRYITLFIFMFLPGVISASILVNSAIVVTFFTLLYLYYYKIYKKHCYILLFLYLFIDNSFAIFYLALLIFSFKNSDKKTLFISLILFIFSMYIYGFTTEGKPKGFLVDTFAIYASIFSPLIFIYFVYTMYRSIVKHEIRDLTWYISVTALIVSIVFSFRQKIYIEDFAPYVVISLPFMMKKFFHSYNVRLKEFRVKHNIAIIITLVMLTLNVLLTVANKPLYLFLDNPKKHFVYEYHFAKEIAQKLKEKNINYIMSDNKELLLRLKFYGIEEGNKYFITMTNYNYYNEKIEIDYDGKNILTLYIMDL